MATIVSAPPDLVVATSDGVGVRFIGIDLVATSWDGKSGMRVNLAAVRGAETGRRDSRFHAAREHWARELTEHGKDAAGPPPTMPAVPVFDRVTVTITDDVGTEYECVAGQVAGDGTDWDAAWVYGPRPPGTATRLRLDFVLDGAPTGHVCLLSLR